jgi:hypothetical protein
LFKICANAALLLLEFVKLSSSLSVIAFCDIQIAECKVRRMPLASIAFAILFSASSRHYRLFKEMRAFVWQKLQELKDLLLQSFV